MTKIEKDYTSKTLKVPGVRDRAHVLLDGVRKNFTRFRQIYVRNMKLVW